MAESAIDTRTIDDLPGPKRLPGLGNALALRPDELHLTLGGWREKFGSLFRVDVGRRVNVCVANAPTINAILRDRPEGFRRAHYLTEVLDEMGMYGVFTAHGEAWQRQRRLAINALNSAHLHRYYDVIRRATERLYHRLNVAADSGEPRAIAHDFAAYTVDVTSALAFGHDLNTLEHDEDDLQQHISAVFQAANRRASLPVPYWRWFRLPVDRALDRSLAHLNLAVGGFVTDARARMEARPELAENPENFLDGMIAAQRSEGRFSDDELISNAMTMLIAGEDTTSNTLSWTAWWLGREPAVQARLADEATTLLGDARFPADHTVAGALLYGDAVMRESLRLNPVAPIIFLEAVEDTTIEDVRVPAGTSVLLLTREPQIQDANFADAARFDPDRWLGDTDRTHDRAAYLPFGAGPRFCPGRNLSVLESKAALAMVARNFRITLDESDGPVREQFGITMAPVGLKVRLQRRHTQDQGEGR